MLVLTRKVNQKIYIPSIDATIEIVEVKGNTVRLGIDAPRNVAVLRQEIVDRSLSVDVSEADLLCSAAG